MRRKVVSTIRVLSNSVQFDYYDHTLECGHLRGNKNPKSKSLECFACNDREAMTKEMSEVLE